MDEVVGSSPIRSTFQITDEAGQAPASSRSRP